jgi:hypothetical protein
MDPEAWLQAVLRIRIHIILRSWIRMRIRVNADPDPTFHCDVDPDWTFKVIK